MKNFLTKISLIVFSTFLVACQPFPTNPSTTPGVKDDDVVGQVTLIVKYPDKTYEEKVDFEKDDTVLDVLDDQLDIKNDNGLVISIENVAQNKETGTYWMYKVNDEMASVGAAELKVKDGDKIEFYLESFE